MTKAKKATAAEATSPFDVYYEGKLVTRLNEQFAKRHNTTPEQLEALRASHVLRHQIFKIAEANEDKPLVLRMLAGVFDTLESEQQKLWNLEPNKNYHRFFDLPGCTCPKMDNEDRLGTDCAVLDSQCPVHGFPEVATN